MHIFFIYVYFANFEVESSNEKILDHMIKDEYKNVYREYGKGKNSTTKS